MAGVVAFQHSQIQRKNAEIATINLLLKQADEAGKQCSESVDLLRIEADKKEKMHGAEIRNAKSKADKAKSRAERIMSTPPTAPGNDCQSAADRVNNWLNERDK